MEQESLSPGDAFAQIDQATDPAQFIRYLAAQESDPFAMRVKAASYALLSSRPGARLLDCGCGLGVDVQALAAVVGPTGLVVGVDNSQAMLEAARTRTAESLPQACYQWADGAALPFPDGTFDGVRCERVLQHLADPVPVVRELIRVARPGAPIVLIDNDFGALYEDLPDMALGERLRAYRLSTVANPYIGRQLFRLLKAGGLHDITIEPMTSVYTTGAAEYYFAFLDEATAAGALAAEENARCRESLLPWFAAGQICYGFTLFVVAGRK